MRVVPVLLLLTLATAGCFGASSFDFEPGTGYEETGNTIRLRMWVADLFQHEVYPGFQANLWAFCAEGLDEASQKAIEYWPRGDNTGSVGDFDPAVRDDDAKCSVPGPTIRVQQGDRVIVSFENDHFHCHTIHWHGQYVPYTSDGVQGFTQDSTCTGESFEYDFIAERAGSLWYHCHVDVQFHVMQGLYGVFIVEPQDTTYEPKDIDKEYVLVYSTLRRELVETVPGDTNPHDDHGAACGGTSGNPGCQNPAVDVTPDTWLLNGQSLPHTMKYFGEDIELDNGVVRSTGSVITIEPGERVRLRLVNAGETFETIHTHGHDMFVTHRDGNPINPAARFWVDSLTIGPAERYDVVLEGRDTEGLWVFHTHVEDHVTNDGMAPGGAFSVIVYPGYEDDLRPFAAELVGGMPYQAPVDFPDDVAAGARLELGTGSNDRTWEWTVDEEMPCATKTMAFSATLQSFSSGIGNPAGSVKVTVVDPDGGVAFDTTLSDASPYAEWLWSRDTKAAQHIELTKGGAYSVTVTGSSTVDAQLDVDIFVDYDDNESEAFEERACGYGPGGHAH